MNKLQENIKKRFVEAKSVGPSQATPVRIILLC